MPISLSGPKCTRRKPSELSHACPPLSPCRRETLQMHLGGLHLEVCSLRRADQAFPQAHGHQALPLLGLRPQLLALRPPGSAPPEAHHDVSRAGGAQPVSHQPLKRLPWSAGPCDASAARQEPPTQQFAQKEPMCRLCAPRDWSSVSVAGKLQGLGRIRSQARDMGGGGCGKRRIVVQRGFCSAPRPGNCQMRVPWGSACHAQARGPSLRGWALPRSRPALLAHSTRTEIAPYQEVTCVCWAWG